MAQGIQDVGLRKVTPAMETARRRIPASRPFATPAGWLASFEPLHHVASKAPETDSEKPWIKEDIASSSRR